MGLPATAKIGFTRLKGIFASGINYKNYDAICQASKNHVLGNIPRDLLSLLICGNPTNKGVAIKAVQSAYEDSACFLSEVGKAGEQYINRQNFSIKKLSEYFQKGLEAIKGKKTPPLMIKDSLYEDKVAELCTLAEESLLKTFKKYLPEAEKVIISPIGEGAFGRGYKVQILNRNNKQVVSNQFLKVYKNSGEGRAIYSKMHKTLSECSDEEYVSFMTEVLKQCGLESTISAQEILSTKKDALETFKNMSLSLSTGSLSSIHGAKAEANIAQYIRSHIGKNLTSKGLIVPEMHNLGKNPFAISEFVDKSQSVSKPFEFRKYGLKHTDFDSNPYNGINGICIDVGGIISQYEGSNIIGRKYAESIIKKFHDTPKNEQMKFLQQLRIEAFGMKDKIKAKETLDAVRELENIVSLHQ